MCLTPLDNLAPHDIIRKDNRRHKHLSRLGARVLLLEPALNVANLSYVCPSVAKHGSTISSWVIAHKYSSGSSGSSPEALVVGVTGA